MPVTHRIQVTTSSKLKEGKPKAKTKTNKREEIRRSMYVWKCVNFLTASVRLVSYHTICCFTVLGCVMVMADKTLRLRWKSRALPLKLQHALCHCCDDYNVV
jgi:hypothetical protein